VRSIIWAPSSIDRAARFHSANVKRVAGAERLDRLAELLV
jgi:hypothetical protein